MIRFLLRIVVVYGCMLLSISAQHKDDYRWDDKFGAPGIYYQSNGSNDSPVSTTLIDDDDIYVGGKFVSAGSRIVKWSLKEKKWLELEKGVNGNVTNLCKWGDYIVVAGEFTKAGDITTSNIALWNKKDNTWYGLGEGVNGKVNCVTIYNNELYAGGEISSAGNKTVNNIARWNGIEWLPVGKGVYYGAVRAMREYKNNLWVGGNFEAADGNKENKKLAVWNGEQWKNTHAMGLVVGDNTSIRDFAVADSCLFISGTWYGKKHILNHIEKNSIVGLVSFDGSQWDNPIQSFGLSHNAFVPVITSYGNELIIGFSLIEEINGTPIKGIAVWNNKEKMWSALEGELSSGTYYSYDLSSLSSDERYIVCGGSFAKADEVFVNNISLFDKESKEWKQFSGTRTNGLVPSSVSTVYFPTKIFELSKRMYAIGSFIFAGEKQVNMIAEWKNNSWEPIGNGIVNGLKGRKIDALSSIGPKLLSFAEYKDGYLIGGDYRIISGDTSSCLSYYNLSEFSEFADGVSGSFSNSSQGQVLCVKCILVDGDKVYIGGTFQYAGGKTVHNIALWDGEKWNDLAGGVRMQLSSTIPEVNVIKKMPDGRIIVGGTFNSVYGKRVPSLAIWNGISWERLGTTDTTDELPTVSDIECDGNNIYVGGTIKTFNTKYMRNIAHWDGNKWNDLHNGIYGDYVRTVKKHKELLYVGGNFDAAGDVDAHNVAVWNIHKKIWMPLGNGLENMENNGFANSIVIKNDTVFFSGAFDRAGSKPSVNIAVWLPPNTTSVEYEEENKTTNQIVNVFPNPARDYIELLHNGVYNSQQNITVHDALGNIISMETLLPEAGTNRIRLNTSSLSTGLYSLRTGQGVNSFSTVFVISR